MGNHYLRQNLCRMKTVEIGIMLKEQPCWLTWQQRTTVRAAHWWPMWSQTFLKTEAGLLRIMMILTHPEKDLSCKNMTQWTHLRIMMKMKEMTENGLLEMKIMLKRTLKLLTHPGKVHSLMSPLPKLTNPERGLG